MFTLSCPAPIGWVALFFLVWHLVFSSDGEDIIKKLLMYMMYMYMMKEVFNDGQY